MNPKTLVAIFAFIATLFFLKPVLAKKVKSPQPPQSPSAQSSPLAISGRILVNDPYYGYPGKPCNQYRRGYQDIMQGVSIVVKNGRGDVMASLSTLPGVNVDTGIETNSTERSVICIVSIPEFQVPDSDFYVFEFGRRGAITKSRQEMQASNWQLQLNIGGN